MKTMSGSTRARERCPRDSAGRCILHNRSTNIRCMKGTQDVSVIMTAHNVFHISNCGRVFGYVYVDKFGLLSLDLHRTQEGLESLEKRVRCGGFAHEASLGEEAVQTTLGHALDSSQHVTAASPRVRCFLVTRKAGTGATVEKSRFVRLRLFVPS